MRNIVAKHASIVRELRPGDFDPKEKFWTRFPPEGSKFTPQHHSVDFRWKDYCPMVFRCVNSNNFLLCWFSFLLCLMCFFFLSKERLVIGCGWYTNCVCVLVVTCWLVGCWGI